MQPKLTLNGQPIDFELCRLLGDMPTDFIVLCFDGVPLEDFGTPYNTPKNRVARKELIKRLNDRTANSLWPQMWETWKPNICRQFGLPKTTTAKDYHPLISLVISRVCPGYSTNLHVAIRLFETLADKIAKWTVIHDGNCLVEIVSKTGGTFWRTGKSAPLLITQTVRDMLKANNERTTL